MKFNDGYWLLRQGVTATYAKEAFAVETSDSTVSVAALSRPVEHRGSHLNTPTVTVDLSSPAQDVVAVRASRRVRTTPPEPDFQLHTTSSEVAVESADGRVSLSAGDLTARLTVDGPFGLEFRRGRPDARDRGPHGPGFHAGGRRPERPGDGPHDAAPHAAGGHQRLRPGRALRPLREERPVGRQLEPGRRDGQRAGLQVAAVLRDRRGLRHLREQPGPGLLRGGSEVVSGPAVLGAGRRARVPRHPRPLAPRRSWSRYTALTGRPALPPRWSFGLWLSTSFLTDYDEATVTHFVDGMAGARHPAERLPLRLLLDEAAPVVRLRVGPRRLPRPRGDAAAAGRQGPAAQRVDQPLPRPAVAAVRGGGPRPATCVRRPDGSVWQTGPVGRRHGPGRLHQPGCARLVRGQGARACSTPGVDAIKTDFGERVPVDVVWHDGSDPALMHNYYTLPVQPDGVRRGPPGTRGRARPCCSPGRPRSAASSSRCTGAATASRATSRWPSPCAAGSRWAWPASASGATTSAGSRARRPPALFKRWTAFGLLSSHSRLHGSELLPGAVGVRRRGGRRHPGVRRAEEPADAVPVGLRRGGAPRRASR